MTITTGSLADPSGPNAIVGAVQWVEGTVLGSAATIVAVIAVACVGLAMLGGRIHYRRGMTVILGCFVLFGARTIATGLSGLPSNASAGAEAPTRIAESPLQNLPTAPSTPSPAPHDPYAGASIIQ